MRAESRLTAVLESKQLQRRSVDVTHIIEQDSFKKGFYVMTNEGPQGEYDARIMHSFRQMNSFSNSFAANISATMRVLKAAAVTCQSAPKRHAVGDLLSPPQQSSQQPCRTPEQDQP